MKKLSFIIIFALSFIVFIGCTTIKEPVYYREYQGLKFIKEGEGIYQNEDKCVFVKSDGTITTNFSDVRITKQGERYEILFSDGCTYLCSDGGCNSSSIPFSHNHSSNYLSLVYEKVDTGTSGDFNFLKFFVVIIFMAFTGFFVFRPRNVEEFLIDLNMIIPLHKQPYEPTDLRIKLTYFGYLTLFIIFTFIFLGMILDIFRN